VLAFILASADASAQKKEERNVPAFKEIAMAIHGNLYLTQGSPQQVVVEADESVLEKLETEVKDGVLKIKFSKPNFSSNKPITIRITVPEVEGLYLSGSGKILAEGKVNTGPLSLKISGSGNLILNDLAAGDVEAAISGSGDIDLTGSGKNMEVAISGSGSINGESFSVGACEISISGSGGCRIDATGKLEVHISGSGNVYYYSSPQIDASISGSGKIKKGEK
jgi:spermidine/putrescine-binding protein